MPQADPKENLFPKKRKANPTTMYIYNACVCPSAKPQTCTTEIGTIQHARLFHLVVRPLEKMRKYVVKSNPFRTNRGTLKQKDVHFSKWTSFSRPWHQLVDHRPAPHWALLKLPRVLILPTVPTARHGSLPGQRGSGQRSFFELRRGRCGLSQGPWMINQL